MTVQIIVVSRHVGLHDVVRTKDLSALSPNLRQVGGEPVMIASFHLGPKDGIEDARRYVARRATNRSGLVVLVDEALVGAFRDLCDTVLLGRLIPGENQRSLINGLNQSVAQGLRVLETVRSKNRDEKWARIIRLPLLNFDAPELAELRALFEDITVPDFKPQLADLLERIRSVRQTPLYQGRNPAPKYVLIDDLNHQFHFGLENHSTPNTAPPHTYACHLRRGFRFGDEIEIWRHFNVSSERTRIDAHDFADCHGAATRCARKDHANAFPGGFVN